MPLQRCCQALGMCTLFTSHRCQGNVNGNSITQQQCSKRFALQYIFILGCFVFFISFFLTSFSGYYCKLQFWDAVFPYYQDLQRLDISVDEDIHRDNPSIKKTWKPSCIRASLFKWPTHGPDPQWICFIWALPGLQMWGVPHYSMRALSPSGSSSRAHQPGRVGSVPHVLHPGWLCGKHQQQYSKEPGFKA